MIATLVDTMQVSKIQDISSVIFIWETSRSGTLQMRLKTRNAASAEILVIPADSNPCIRRWDTQAGLIKLEDWLRILLPNVATVYH